MLQRRVSRHCSFLVGQLRGKVAEAAYPIEPDNTRKSLLCPSSRYYECIINLEEGIDILVGIALYYNRFNKKYSTEFHSVHHLTVS